MFNNLPKASTTFFEVPSLTEYSTPLGSNYLLKNGFKNADTRYFGEVLHKFSLYNARLFNFLQVKPIINGNSKHATINFSSGKFIGAIPLTSPVNGLQIGDFIVKPRFTSETNSLFSYGEIISLIESDITPDFTHSLTIKSKNSLKPPLYIQASKFITLFYRMLKSSEWLKFQNLLNLLKEPKGEIYWKRYVETEHDPQKKIIYPCKINVLSPEHKEFFEIVYVYKLARKEVLSANSPIPIRIQLERLIMGIDSTIYGFPDLETKGIRIHQFDFPIIKELKKQANILLANSLKDVTAWRIDIALLFEKYIQFLFTKVTKKINYSQVNNPRISRHGINFPDWSLKYLEPDLILKDMNNFIVIDAKYKSHYFNINQNTSSLHDEHRNDIHQILAYSSFIGSNSKTLMICYPFSKFSYKKIEYSSDYLGGRANLYIVGIPIDIAQIPNVEKNLIDLILGGTN